MLGEDCQGGQEFDLPFVDLPPERWYEAARRLREFGFAFFDWLSAYEESDGFAVAVHLWSASIRSALLLRTVIEGAPPTLASITSIWRGADWHERETAEMFGMVFAGHPNPAPLLLADDFEGHPLRKDFHLPARDRPWPGASDPDPGAARRRRPSPYGADN